MVETNTGSGEAKNNGIPHTEKFGHPKDCTAYITRLYEVDMTLPTANKAIVLRHIRQFIDGKEQIVGVNSRITPYPPDHPRTRPQIAILKIDGSVEGDPSIFEWAGVALSRFDARNTNCDAYGATRQERIELINDTLRGVQSSIQKFTFARNV